MAGVLIASIGSGQLITRDGRYKVFPIVGTGADGRRDAAALAAHRRARRRCVADLYMLVLGLGLGFVMQVLILAVQNAVDYRDLGVATASATLFRSMGGTIGVPIFGAIFTNQLATHARRRSCRRVPPGSSPSHLGPDADRQAAAGDSRPVRRRLRVVAAPGVPDRRPASRLAAFAFTWLLEERPLRQTVADQGIGDSFASPRDADARSTSWRRGSARSRDARTATSSTSGSRAPPGSTSRRARPGCCCASIGWTA